MLRIVIDEDFDHRKLRGLVCWSPNLDYVLAQELSLFRVHGDPALLEWAAAEGRVLVTHDMRTMPKHAYDRIEAGEPVAGVIVVPKQLPISEVVEELHLIVECCDPSEFADQVKYLPLKS